MDGRDKPDHDNDRRRLLYQNRKDPSPVPPCAAAHRARRRRRGGWRPRCSRARRRAGRAPPARAGTLRRSTPRCASPISPASRSGASLPPLPVTTSTVLQPRAWASSRNPRRRERASRWRSPCRSILASISILPEAIWRTLRRSRSASGGAAGVGFAADFGGRGALGFRRLGLRLGLGFRRRGLAPGRRRFSGGDARLDLDGIDRARGT